MESPFAELYKPTARDKAQMGDGYNPPAEFSHGQPQLVGAFAASEDGQPVEVYEIRLPASFFKIVVLPTASAPGYTLETGSGMGHLAQQIARAIAGGMLGLATGEEADAS